MHAAFQQLSSPDHAAQRAHAVLARVSPSYPPYKGRSLTCYAPVRHWAPKSPVRLACVKRAASVRPEPGSNSPINLKTRLAPKQTSSFKLVRNSRCFPLTDPRGRDAAVPSGTPYIFSLVPRPVLSNQLQKPSGFPHDADTSMTRPRISSTTFSVAAHYSNSLSLTGQGLEISSRPAEPVVS